ncbi:hypothetical protein AABD41_01360 [Staphylococcus pseudoxylosus]|uniref:hypothetical protein n=1 Tax=Staphylococcus pseudoxylosus TaxID=2282419 RepID=UPI00398A8D20
MSKLNLDRVKGHYVESIKADKEYGNGALVGKGLLLDGEIRMYEAVEATEDNHFLVSTPEIDFTAKPNGSSSIDFVNDAGSVMRVHQLEVGDTFTVEQSLHAAGLKTGASLTVTGGQFVDGAGAGSYVLEYATTIGADRRPAYSIRKVK